MKKILFGILVFFCCQLSAQFSPPAHPFFPNPPIVPYNYGLKYWWVHTDLPLNSSVNAWIDRISSAVWENGAVIRQPTNSGSGVFVSERNWLTNGALINLYSNWALGIVVERIGASQSYPCPFVGTGNSSLEANYPIGIASADSVYAGGNIGLYFPTNKYCIVYNIRTNSHYGASKWEGWVYTNGVCGYYSTNGTPSLQSKYENMWYMGYDIFRDIRGVRAFIKEIRVWTNTLPTNAVTEFYQEAQTAYGM